MKRKISRFIPGLALAAALVAASVLAAGLTSAASADGVKAAPSLGPSLSNWRMVLPVNSAGQRSGNDAEVLNPAKVDSPWLERTASGRLDFWAPSVGATTPGSTHARTELDSNSSFTLGQGTSQALHETLEVTVVPPQTKDIIIAQLFEDGSTGAGPYMMLHYQAGTVYAFVTGYTQYFDLLSNVPIGASFSAVINAHGSDLTFKASYDGKTGTKTVKNTAAFLGKTVLWHAGDYQQDVSTGDSDSDGGRVIISNLYTSKG